MFAVLGGLAGTALVLCLLVPLGLWAVKRDTCPTLGDVYTDLAHVCSLRENGRWDVGSSAAALTGYVCSDALDWPLCEWRALERDLVVPEGMKLTHRQLGVVRRPPVENAGEGVCWGGDRTVFRLFYEPREEDGGDWKPEDWKPFIVSVYGVYLRQMTQGKGRNVGYTSSLTVYEGGPAVTKPTRAGALYGELGADGILSPQGAEALQEQLAQRDFAVDSAVCGQAR